MSTKELGLRCPKCKQVESMRILCEVWSDVDDSGTDNDGDHEYADTSECICPKCDWYGTVLKARVCVHCGNRMDGELDHIELDGHSNILHLCRECANKYVEEAPNRETVLKLEIERLRAACDGAIPLVKYCIRQYEADCKFKPTTEKHLSLKELQEYLVFLESCVPQKENQTDETQP